jgi:MFS transporter, PPP family, 3-phenylpropionic acid transporter
VAPAGRLRLFYFLYYANVGAYLSYFAPYLLGLGFRGGQIGTIQAGPSMLAPAVAIAWATWADRRASPVRALRRASAWVAVVVLLLPFARTPPVLAAVVLAMALGDRAVVPLLDSTTLEWCRADPAVSYGRLRLFGSLGYIALSLGVGAALSARGDRPADPLVPMVVVACLTGYALLARGLPETPAHGEPRPGFGDALALLRDRGLVLLLAAGALHWAACAPYHLFFGALVRDRGLSAVVTGLGTSLGAAAEIAVLFLFGRIHGRAPLRALLAVSFLGSAVRWVLLSRASAAAEMILLQLVHGLTFGLFWGSAVAAMGEAVPARLRATGQALFTAVVFGAGNGLGCVLSGIGYDTLGAAPVFAWAGIAEIIPLALVCILPAPRRGSA